MKSCPTISIIIPSQGKPAHLATVVRGLLVQDVPIHEILIVLDPEDPGKLSYNKELREWQHMGTIEVVWARIDNRSAKRNAGLKRASGEIVLFLDDDCVPQPGLILSHVSSHGSSNAHFAVSFAYSLSSEITTRFLAAEIAVDTPIELKRDACISRMAKAAVRFWEGDTYKPPLPGWILFVTRCVSIQRKYALEFGERFLGWGVEDWDFGWRLWRRSIAARVLQGPSVMHLAHDFSPTKSGDLLKNLRFFLRRHPFPDVALAVRFDPRALRYGPDAVLRWNDISFNKITKLLRKYDQATSKGKVMLRNLWRMEAEFYLYIRNFSARRHDQR